jgi:hypothetical protein
LVSIAGTALYFLAMREQGKITAVEQFIFGASDPCCGRGWRLQPRLGRHLDLAARIVLSHRAAPDDVLRCTLVCGDHCAPQQKT